MRSQRSAHYLLVVGLVLALAACGPAQPINQAASPAAPANTPAVVEPAGTALVPTDVVLQYDVVPTFAWVAGTDQPWGHVPPLTLFADGTMIYLAGDNTVMHAQLTAGEMHALVDQVVALGFERLQTETDGCQTQNTGEQLCTADASNMIFRVRLPEGSLREVTIYEYNDQDPAVLQSITQVLDGYQHPDARPYQPTYATLFVRGVPSGHLEAPAWPLSTDWVTPITDTAQVVIGILEGDELDTMLAATSFRTGGQLFQHGTQRYTGIVSPWLPGADHRAAMTAFAPLHAGTAPAGRPPDATPVP